MRQPCWEGLIPPGQPTQFPEKIFILQVAIPESSPLAAYPHQPWKVGKVLDGLPPPHTSLQALQLDLSLIAHNKTMPVRGRTALFSTNWVKLTLDQWVLATVQHSYQNINAVHVPHKGLQCQKGCLQFEVVNMVI